MPYAVTITHRPTGFRVVHDEDGRDWSDSLEDAMDFTWVEGNRSCDCNRRILFLRALGVPEEWILIDGQECSDPGEPMEFSVVLPDGTEHPNAALEAADIARVRAARAG